MHRTDFFADPVVIKLKVVDVAFEVNDLSFHGI
jgi:hypothetical protein